MATTTRAQAGKSRPRSHANTLLASAQILLAACLNRRGQAPGREETSLTGQETAQ